MFCELDPADRPGLRVSDLIILGNLFSKYYYILLHPGFLVATA